MKRIITLAGIIMLLMSSCLIIENEPFVVVNPSLEFKAHIRKDSVYITSNVFANPVFVDPGNIPTIIKFQGEVELYDEETGFLLGSSEIVGSGLNTLVEVATKSEKFEHIIIIATGIVSAYADNGDDGDESNNTFLHESDFYEEIYLRSILDIEGYPVVTVDPEIDFQTYFLSEQLVTSASISANPEYIVAGNIPVIFAYDGVIQVSDVASGSLLNSTPIDDEGLSITVSILADTASYNDLVVVVSGTLTARADLGSDGDPSNDLFITKTEFNEIRNFDLSQF